MANPIVVDLSHHNPTPDWATLKAGGTIGIIHKATEGTSYVDDTLFSRAKAAMNAGLCWSTYHFMRPGNIEAQIDHYLSTVDPLHGERVCLDHEDAGVSVYDLKDAVQHILDTRPDLQITIYSGHLIKEQLGPAYDPFLAENTSLWIAQYTNADAPSWPSGTWPQWSLWQYSDKCSVDGCSANVDGNRWNGDPANLAKWFGPADAVVPEPEPEPEPEVAESVAIDVMFEHTQGVKVTLKINGKEVEVA